MKSKRFTDLTKDEIRQIVKDIFEPEKITCIQTNKKYDEITCKIYTKCLDENEKEFIIPDEVTLRNPFYSYEDCIEVDFQVNDDQKVKLLQFCFAKQCFPDTWVVNNPYLINHPIDLTNMYLYALSHLENLKQFDGDGNEINT